MKDTTIIKTEKNRCHSSICLWVQILSLGPDCWIKLLPTHMIQQSLSVSEYHVQEMSDKTKFHPEVLVPGGRILWFRMCCVWWNLKNKVEFKRGASTSLTASALSLMEKSLSPSICKAQGDSGSLEIRKHLHLVPVWPKWDSITTEKKSLFCHQGALLVNQLCLHLTC